MSTTTPLSSENITLIQAVLSDFQIDIDPSRIRLKGNTIKLIIPNSDSLNDSNIVNKLKEKIQNFDFVLIHDSQVSPSSSKSAKKVPHAPKGSIRPASFKKIIVVASGKGGVGKSAISLNLARCLQAKGLKTAFIDCDIYGPSIPVMTGGYTQAEYKDNKLQPVMRDDIETMSIGYMINPAKALVWRGPMVSGAIAQMFEQTQWGDIDVAIVDMPPGTGDAQLTVCQNLQADGAIIVSQPQLVSIIDAERCAAMFDTLNLPIWGVIENMSGFVAPDTQKTYYIFGEGGAKSFAQAKNYPFLGALPIVPMIAYCSDQGINPLSPQTQDDCNPFMSPLMDIADYICVNNLNMVSDL